MTTKIFLKRVPVDVPNRILFRTGNYETQDITTPIPKYITLDFLGAAELDVPDDAVVYLGEQPFEHLPAPTEETAGEHNGAPLWDDEYTCDAFGVKISIQRQKTIPNPNCYDVFYGKKNVGYIRLPFHSKIWGCAIIVQGSGLYKKFTSENIFKAMDDFCQRLGEILGVTE